MLGTSAPLFAVLLAALHRLTGVAIPTLAYGIGVLALPAAAALGYRLARRVSGPVLAAAFVAAALSPLQSLRVFASGMETPLLLCGALLAVELACRGRATAAFAVSGGLAFLHPDAVLLAAALFLASGIRGAWPWRALAVGLLPACAGALTLTAVYGSPVPQSVRAKHAVYEMAPFYALAELSETVQDVAVAREAPNLARPPLDAALGLVLPLVVALAAGATLFRAGTRLRSLPVLALGLYAAMYLVAFAVGNPLVFEWYHPPLALSVAFVLCAAAAALGPRPRAAWAAVLAATALFHAVRFTPYDPSGREEVYARAVEALAPGPSDVIAAPEIGAVGWATRARILDAVGLVSPEAFRFGLSAEGGSVAPRLIRETDATALVSFTRFLLLTERVDPGALARWRLVARFPARAFGGDGEVRVYRRTR